MIKMIQNQSSIGTRRRTYRRAVIQYYNYNDSAEATKAALERKGVCFK
jgi:hypothetical protein